MKKRNCFFIMFLIFIFANLFIMKNISSIIVDSCKIWLYNLLPSILPFYIISDLLINYGFINILKTAFKKPFTKLFKISESSIFILIFSMLTGFASSAKYIRDLIKEDLISIEEANKIIRFCHFSNPLFVINIIGIKILGSKKLGFYILISHFISNFIIALLFRKEIIKLKNFKYINQEKLGNVLSKSIINSFDTALIILGNIIIFQLLNKIISNYFDFNSNLNSIISIFIEITNGIFMLNNANFSIISKALIITSAISFGGICIHSQVYAILSDANVKYKNYLVGRILQAIIAPIIFLLLCY